MNGGGGVGHITDKVKGAAGFFRRAFGFFGEYGIAGCALLSLALEFVIECLSHKGIISALWFTISSLQFFIIGFAVIAVTMSAALFFKRRWFVYAAVAIPWMTFGVTQRVLMGIRAEPFAAVDFVILMSAFRLVPSYIGVGGIILSLGAIGAAVFGAVILFRRAPKCEPCPKKAIAFILSCALVILFGYAGGSFVPELEFSYEDAVEAYDRYGFTYCFTRSFFDFGVEEPDEYSEESVKELLSKLSDEKDDATDFASSPNVVFLQLESFFDPSYINDLEMTENPLPNFTAMKENFTSGKLHVNTIGGGTANTEFQVLCGMNLSHFGICEYPYSTILDNKTAPSLATVFTSVGYTACAMHNHTATFYGRNSVYANLGFDTFVPVEYMNGVEYNAIGWEKDSVLTSQITDALESSAGRDFVFAVSVEGHGNYPDYDTVGENGIHVSGVTYTESRYRMEYYVNTLKSMDDFLGSLTEALEKYPEPVMLVVYGDHMPSLGLTENDISYGSLYYTEYVIWTNYESEREVRDIESYKLGSLALSKLGIRGNAINRLHNEMSFSDGDFQEKLKLLEYDILYGDNFSTEAFVPDMKFGLHDIRITSCVKRDSLVVYGENFTPFSAVFVNGVKRTTEFVSPNMLVCPSVRLSMGQEISVSQISGSVTKLPGSKSIRYGK